MAFPVDVMTDSLGLSHKTGDSAYGPVWTAAADVDAYVEPDDRVSKNARGEEVVYALFAIVASGTVVAIGDKVEYGGNSYEVAKANSFPACGNEAGHIELNLRSIAT